MSWHTVDMDCNFHLKRQVYFSNISSHSTSIPERNKSVQDDNMSVCHLDGLNFILSPDNSAGHFHFTFLYFPATSSIFNNLEKPFVFKYQTNSLKSSIVFVYVNKWQCNIFCIVHKLSLGSRCDNCHILQSIQTIIQTVQMYLDKLYMYTWVRIIT